MRALRVEPQEELQALMERLRGLPAGQPLDLLISDRTVLTGNPLRVQELARFADQLGLEVRVVSDDRDVLEMARRAGLPAVQRPNANDNLARMRSVQIGAGMAWTEADPAWWAAIRHFRDHLRTALRPSQLGAALRGLPARLRDQDRRSMRAVGALIGLTAVLFALIFIPSAKVTIVARPLALTGTDVSVVAQVGQNSPIAIREVTSNLTVNGTFAATGTSSSGSQTASGTVVYSNHCRTNYTIPSGTVLHGSGLSFLQSGDVHIASKKTSTGRVVATQPGSAGNLAAGSITTIDLSGTIAGCVSISSSGALSGGANGQVQSVLSPADLDLAHGQLAGQLLSQGADTLARQAANGEQLGQSVTVQAPVFESDHSAGDQVTQFQATISAQVIGILYHPSELDSLLRSQLLAQAGNRLLADRSLTFESQISSLNSDGTVTFTGHAQGLVAPRLNEDAIRTHLAGQTMA
ncbi:MAG TPA: baseplate J/gp47 family protein, partial [Candidatus Dormibacteraeota bacterium]|nr:baseplate J/gp47 family protein [Candidatus Dormibacteraeota bacterium]